MTDQQRRVGKLVIQVNGNDLPDEILSSLDEAVVEDDLGQPAMFTLRFNDPQLKLTDGKQFSPGHAIKIGGASSADGQPQTILSAEITALEPIFEQHNIVLVVRGYDRSHRLHRGSKTRTFLKQSDSDIVNQIAREAGLRPDTEPSGGSHEYVIQDNQTDMQFLRARAARNGFQVVVDDQKLTFRSAEAAPPQAPAQEWGTTLLAFRARLSATAQPNEVQVRGWDPKIKRPLVGKASRPAQPWRIGEPKNGGQLAQQAFGAAATLVVSDQLVRNQGEADRLAQAILDEHGGDFLTAEGTCFGEPALRAGARVELIGIGQRLSGSYFVTATRHTYTSAEGYLTTFFANGRRAGGLLAVIESNVPQQRSGGVVVGIVTNNNDPEKLGRVKLKFPWLDDKHESDWSRLAAPGAGSKRGFLVVPEIDDEVLVAFEQGDLSRPYVIGGLWNGKDTPPKADVVKGGKVEDRIFTTRAGHTILLSDKQGQEQIQVKSQGGCSITLSDKQGQEQIEAKTRRQTITLTDQGQGKVTIESSGEVEIKGSGGKLAISAQGVELTSNTNLKIQATAVLDVKTSAVLNIQGLPVKIN